MFQIVWGSAGFCAGHEIICQRDFNKEYFLNEMMQQLADRLFLERRAPHTFVFEELTKFFEDNSLVRARQPASSLDIAPS
jgi:hypothetical protein